MPARVSTENKTFKGRTIASVIRTNFGPKAVFVPAEDSSGGTVTVNGAAVATVIYASEWKREKPVSRQRRWENACAKLREAMDNAQELFEEFDNAVEDEDGVLRTDGGEGEEFDNADAEQRASDATDLWSEGISELEELQGEYQDWYDNLPDALQYDSPVADKLQEVTNLYFEYVTFSYDEDAYDAECYVDEYEYVDLPLGWGRD